MLGLAVLFVFLAVAALVLALGDGRRAARVPIERRLMRASGVEPVAVETNDSPALRRSRFSRYGSVTRYMAGKDSLRELDSLLDHSGWHLSVSRFLVISAFTGALIGFLGWSKLGAMGLPLGLIGALLPLFMLKRTVKKRRNAFIGQLVDALQIIANGLKAGSGLLQALAQAAEQLKAPISEEFKRTLRDIQIGATPDEAFTALNERIGGDDLDIVVTAIIVQRSTGGNLAEILETVSFTMRDRIRIRGEIKTLTTQQQYSGYLVGMLPIGLLGLFSLINRPYMMPLFTTTAGNLLLAVGGGLQLLGFFMIRKIVNIEV